MYRILHIFTQFPTVWGDRGYRRGLHREVYMFGWSVLVWENKVHRRSSVFYQGRCKEVLWRWWVPNLNSMWNLIVLYRNGKKSCSRCNVKMHCFFHCLYQTLASRKRAAKKKGVWRTALLFSVWQSPRPAVGSWGTPTIEASMARRSLFKAHVHILWFRQVAKIKHWLLSV